MEYGAWSLGVWGMRGSQALRLELADLTPGTPESNENPPPKYRLGKKHEEAQPGTMCAGWMRSAYD